MCVADGKFSQLSQNPNVPNCLGSSAMERISDVRWQV